MKSIALFAAFVAVSTAQFGGASSPAVTSTAALALKGPLQNVALATHEVSLPKCFPECW